MPTNTKDKHSTQQSFCQSYGMIVLVNKQQNFFGVNLCLAVSSKARSNNSNSNKQAPEYNFKQHSNVKTRKTNERATIL